LKSTEESSNDKLLKELLAKVNSVNKKLNYTGNELREAKRQRMDCWTPSKRTQDEQHEFKQALVDYYERQDTVVPGNLFCMILNRSYPRNQVRASHIWKYATQGKGLVEFKLSFEDISSPRNGMLLAEDIEKAFDSKQVCFICGLGKDITLAVLDPTLLTQFVSPSTSKTFNDINGAVLQFPTGKFPYRRILNWHAKLAYEEAFSRMWINDNTFQLYQDYGNLSEDASNPDYDYERNWESDDE